MRQQILRNITMLILVGAVALITAVDSANGQSSHTTVSAKVPFEFRVGGNALPAGDYTVRTMTDAGSVLGITNQDNDRTTLRLTNPIQTAKISKKAKLVFHRYGQTYFLSEVWSGRENTGRRLLKSKQEREMESQLAAISSKSELARNNYETIEIVAMAR
ncbi:MAG: hypothetical protein ND895_22335 [Pyrinomonadaceae bacterium]|nr:hypothetical protein [Pyrinomonadaceae bacterium]